jgi:hypothetical protein
MNKRYIVEEKTGHKIHTFGLKKKRQTYRFRKPNRPQHIVIKVLKKKDTKQEVKEIKTLFSENQQHN